MIIDVIVTSCARPDVLDVSFSSFRKKVISDRQFRYIIIEDKVDDEKRQEEGRKWIEKHKHLFHKIVFLKEKAGPGYWYTKNIEHCTTNYHFHLEDDNEFVEYINLDYIIEILQNNPNIVQIMCSRGRINPANKPRKVIIDGLELTESNLYSVATGVFNTKNVLKVIDKVGRNIKLHEFGNLTPASKELGLRKFVLGHDKIHYIHVGAEKGYRKGRWKG